MKENKIPPIEFINKVPFTSQAPYFKWDQLHDESCEEASVLIAHNYLIDTTKIEMRNAEDEIQNMVAFQKETLFGSHKDLNAEEIIELAKEYYQENYKLIHLADSETNKELGNEEDSEEDKKTEKFISEKIQYIKKELSKGNIFIVPAAGQELGNPYFHEPGPLYHALVITGYDDSKKEFITNDPGTRRGEGFRYSYETLWNAIHDFPGKKTDILNGNKVIILVEK